MYGLTRIVSFGNQSAKLLGNFDTNEEFEFTECLVPAQGQSHLSDEASDVTYPDDISLAESGPFRWSA